MFYFFILKNLNVFSIFSKREYLPVASSASCSITLCQGGGMEKIVSM